MSVIQKIKEKGSMILVQDLEHEFSTELIEKRFKHSTSCYGEDFLIIKSKKQGFGILFYSEKFDKEYHLDSSVLLKVA